MRAVLYRLALTLNRPAANALVFMRKNQWRTASEVRGIQESRLEVLLAYAYHHVPYYHRLFEEKGLAEGGKLRLERFSSLPFLDKPLIRANFRDLVSDEAHAMHARENRTSGSTGEPLVVMQGRDAVRVTGGAVLRLFYEWHGLKPGDREVKLWGSERDLFHGGSWSMEGLRNWASGVKVQNAFRMTPERMRAYIQSLNTYHPKVLRGYSSNLYELARFAEEERITVRPPGLVISSAGTLYPFLRETMERVFGCHAFNHYGSRDMHNMAMECPAGNGLHISSFTHLLEVVDDAGRPCPDGVEGDFVVTSLPEFTMPLIRYHIGDRGTMAVGACPCGRGLPLIEKVSGRRVDCFWTREGNIVPGEYFLHLLAVHLKDNPISKFQVIQEDYDNLRFRLVLRPGGTLNDNIRKEIEEKTKLVLGPGCILNFEIVKDIPPESSGKFLYTRCSIPGRSQPTMQEEARPPGSSCP